MWQTFKVAKRTLIPVSLMLWVEKMGFNDVTQSFQAGGRIDKGTNRNLKPHTSKVLMYHDDEEAMLYQSEP